MILKKYKRRLSWLPSLEKKWIKKMRTGERFMDSRPNDCSFRERKRIKKAEAQRTWKIKIC